MDFYHSGQRALQARFGSQPLADRLLSVTHRTTLTDDDRAFIESREFFFLATSDLEARPDCTFKGGPPGFVRAPAPDLIVWPDYDGNGMFRSLGNIAMNPEVGLLFIAMTESPKRLRVNGRASIAFDDPLLSSFPGAQALLKLVPTHIFPNCPRYIPDAKAGTPSPYVPKAGTAPAEPAWKSFDVFKDVVPARTA